MNNFKIFYTIDNGAKKYKIVVSADTPRVKTLGFHFVIKNGIKSHINIL